MPRVFPSVALLLFLVSSLSAQTIDPGISVGAITAAPGATVTITISFTAGTNPVSATQLDLVLPSGVSFSNAEVGAVGTAADKVTAFAPVGNAERFIIYGLNQNAIASGELLKVSLQIAPSLTDGTLPLDLTGVLSASPEANLVATSGSPGSITIDSIAPTASLTAPFSFATLRGNVSLGALGTDNTGIRSVQYFVDGISVTGEIVDSPFSATIDTKGITDGIHTLIVRVKDLAGNVTDSLGTEIAIGNSTPSYSFRDFDGDGTTDVLFGKPLQARILKTATSSPGSGEFSLVKLQRGEKIGFGDHDKNGKWSIIGALLKKSGYEWRVYDARTGKPRKLATFGVSGDTPIFGCESRGKATLALVRKSSNMNPSILFASSNGTNTRKLSLPKNASTPVCSPTLSHTSEFIFLEKVNNAMRAVALRESGKRILQTPRFRKSIHKPQLFVLPPVGKTLQRLGVAFVQNGEVKLLLYDKSAKRWVESSTGILTKGIVSISTGVHGLSYRWLAVQTTAGTVQIVRFSANDGVAERTAPAALHPVKSERLIR